jgi:hypothetical protein
MMEAISIFEVVTLVGGIVGVYLKLTQEVGRLKGRIAMLERQETEVKKILTDLVTAVNEIKLLLAEKGMR